MYEKEQSEIEDFIEETKEEYIEKSDGKKIEEPIDDSDKSKDNLIYNNKTKEFIKKVGHHEGIELQIPKITMEKIDDSIQLLTTIMTYEVILRLKRESRKRVQVSDIQYAVDGLLSQADALNIAVKKLNETIESMNSESKDMVIQKASMYLNFDKE